MSVVSLDSLNFSDLLWTFKLLPCKHRHINIWYSSLFANMFYRPMYILLGNKSLNA